MVLLTFILILVLQCEVGVSETKHVLYLTPGNDVIMPCDNVPDTCSMVIWAYSKHESQTINMVHNGIVEKNSAQADRLSLHSNCSLSINNITAEDAGQYFCRPEGNADQDTTVDLNILTISAFPSDTDPKDDGNVTLECSLFRYYPSPCKENSMRWVDETGSVLWDRDVKNTGHTCVSLLTVKLQSGNKKRYTCQFEDNNTVKIEAHYTPVLIDSTPNKAFIIIGAVMLVLVVAVIAAVFIKYRRRAKVTEDIQKPTQPKHNEEILQGVLGQLISDEPESSITYATIDHTDQNASLRKTVKKEEAVTYSAVKTKVESDPSGFYSIIS
uniref:Ig-like domain-containing protein n=1 Tax=Astatotilapia calliptera TaxID=8154 RepID=A0AAX7VSW6_ASTCA